MSNETNLVIGQSGGPTTAINASLSGIISAALKESRITNIYGAVHGIRGILDEHLENLSLRFKDHPEKIEVLKYTPSMFLGSCRYKLPKDTESPEIYHKIFNIFSKYKIQYFLYIGGNDSMDTVSKLSHYAEKIGSSVQIIGIPKTIDNDLLEIDHTPGFGSAAKYIAASILEIAHDTYIYDLPSIFIVEIMGRNAGWLTAASALSRNSYSRAPHLIYLPEIPFSTSQFIKDVKYQLSIRKHVIIAVSEGIQDTEGAYISSQASRIDQFGHIMLSGTGKYLENLIVDAIGCKVRSIELNVLQRCASHVSSKTDIEEAFRLGQEGLTCLLAGKTGNMVTVRRISSDPYEVEYGSVSVDKVANMEKKVPREWISESGNNVTNELISYLSPLIQGECEIPYKSGIPEYLFLD